MTSMSRQPPYQPREEFELLDYLTSLYRNVFTEEAIRAHLVNHVGYPVAEYGLGVVTPLLARGARILDVGAGFGSFVLLAREAGFDATGVEIAPFEVEFARQRLARIRPQDDPKTVYRVADATRLALPAPSLDAVTFWNLFEHVENVEPLIAFAARALAPGGYAFIVCPNYAARRDEAHYHVPWNPELRHDRSAAIAYLRSLGRDAGFFETSIFCRTNTEVLGLLRKHAFQLIDIDGLTPMSPTLANLPGLIRNWRQVRSFYDPQRPSVLVAGRKLGARSAA
jgi:MPBQ/MSBQ methyltransferase